jgi:hypothetical protein
LLLPDEVLSFVRFPGQLINYFAFSIIFWFVIAAVVLQLANGIYVGYPNNIIMQKRPFYKTRYTLSKGEVRSVYLLRIARLLNNLFVSILFIPFMCIFSALWHPPRHTHSTLATLPQTHAPHYTTPTSLTLLLILFENKIDVMNLGLACDYQSSSGTPLLVFFESEKIACWGSKNLAIAIVAILFMVIFLASVLLISLTYYEHDPNAINMYLSLLHLPLLILSFSPILT